MFDPKNNLSKQFFGRMEAVKDYHKATKLYEKYNKLVEQMKDEQATKLLLQLIPLIHSASEGMERIYNIYKKAYDDTQKLKNEDRVGYSDIERKAYFEEIERMRNEANELKKKLSPAPKKEEGAV